MRGNRKGSAFERKIAKSIVKAFKHFGIEQRDCWRSVLSGGHSMSSGDLTLSKKLEKLFPYAVECKHRKQIRWINFLLDKKSEEQSWLAQALDGALKREGLLPLLVMRANNFPIMVMLLDFREGKRVRLSGKSGLYWSLTTWKDFIKKAVPEKKNGGGKKKKDE